MSNRKPTQLSPQQRHAASGNSKPFTGRWNMLHELMLRNDLSHAEHRVLYLLYAIRANSNTGLCFTTDARMAEDLGLHVRSIERAKASLKAKGLLRWTTDRLRGRNDVCVYDLNAEKNTDNSVASIVGNTGDPVAEIPTSAPDVSSIEYIKTLHGISTEMTPRSFYAPSGSPELEAWDRWGRIHRGKSYPRDRAGGWDFPSRWPPRTQIDLEDLLAT